MIAVESRDFASIDYVTDRGVILGTSHVEVEDYDDGFLYAQYTLLPWDQVLSINIVWRPTNTWGFADSSDESPD